MRQVALTFLAHPDDAEILCGGVLIRLRELGWEVHIATLTAGDCGTHDHGPWQISAIRTEEARRAAALIGATYHCLGEMDGYVVYDRPTLGKAYDLFRCVGPGLVFTHPPADYMMDHEVTHRLGRAASFLYGAPNVSRLPLRGDGAIPTVYYCDPVDGIDPLGQSVEPTTVVDISRQLERKAEMLACHSSQRQWLRDHHGIDEYIDAIRRRGAARGELIGASAGEAFVQHRGHAYPQVDLLRKLFV